MSDTTVIPPGTNTAGFHSHDTNRGGRDHGILELLISQHTSNEGRSNLHATFDTALVGKDSTERLLVSQKSDAERIHIRIDDARLESVKQVNDARIEARVMLEDLKTTLLRIDTERAHRELADVKAEVQLLKMKNPAITS